jgi:DNA-binding IclR family transcriptional regulator
LTEKATAALGPVDRQRGIDRVIDILEALLKNRDPMRIGELARRLGAPRSTLYTIVNRLVAAELLETTDDDGAIYFGRAVHLYGTAYLASNPLQKRCREVLDRLATESDATAQLCAMRGNKYVVLDSRSGSGLFRITTDIGVPVPLPWTASGRLLLDHLPPDEITALIPPEDYRLPDGRTVDPGAFLAEVAQARADGRCITTGLSDRFTSCLAAPIRNARRQAIATLCFVVPAEQPEARKAELLARLVDAAGLVSKTL